MAGADRPRRSPGAAAEADPPPRRYPFLPPDRVLGWTPYVWLVYLSFFLVEPLAGGASPGEWIATAAVLAAFLPLYFWGYWLRGRLALVPSALILLLGILSAPWNFGGSVFFVYAAAYLGHAVPAREAKRWLVAVPLVAVAEWQLLGLPWLFPVVAGVLSLLIGGINIHDAEVRRRDEALRRSQAEVERLAQVAERERIGRDLHDLLGHTLSLIALKAELAARLIERGGCLDGDDRAAAGREVREVEAISRRALAEVRQAVLGYRAEGLAAELERADAALTGAGIACRRDVSPVPLDADTDRTLAFALREATTNVLRHSAARTCTLSLAADEREVRLEVADDGRGGTAPDGAGLTGMRERLALAGGRVERDGAGGTRLVAIVPRRPAAAGARR